MSRTTKIIACWLFLAAIAAGGLQLDAARPEAVRPVALPAHQVDAQAELSKESFSPPEVRAVLDRYCITCHNEKLRTRGTVPVSFEGLDLTNVGAQAEALENMVQKLRAGVMPPVGLPRPDQATHDSVVLWLETELDRAVAARPDPGRPLVRRLTRAEYTNAIRDLLAFDIDGQSLMFPADDVDQHGFDTNGGVLSVSPVLLERYLATAYWISRVAVGDPTMGPGFAAAFHRLPKMLYQDDRMSEDLPFGSRGGIAVRHAFPLDGEYLIKVQLKRQIYEYIIGMATPQKLDIRLDGNLMKRFTVGGADSKGYPSAFTFFGTIRGDPAWEEYVSSGGDQGLEVRFPAKAGMHTVGVSFIRHLAEPTGVLEPRRLSGFSLSGMDFYHANAAIGTVAITGPYNATGPGETASRRKIFICRPMQPADEDACAKQILSTLARRAYRRPVTTGDLEPLLEFYQAGRRSKGFEMGIQQAVERLLASPEFLFRIEQDPVNLDPGTVYRLSDLELVSRLSFFLWSSIPDDELLDVAAAGKLGDPEVLERQVRRMLADDRSTALVENFASQWLQLRRLRGVTLDPDRFPEFDENLRVDMEQETKLFVESVLREDRSLVDLLTADYTFVNERLARHYQIPNIYGERFRRVTFDTAERGGLLGHASLLTVTAYPTRTSPVLRGRWVLDNILGMPPPEPPVDVPPLEENSGRSILSMRDRMEQHRKNPVCASCHRVMDPLGFALENYDAIGRWRNVSEAGTPIDASGALADGTRVDGPSTLQQALLKHKEQFVRTATGKLLVYALGRELTPSDQPALRMILREAAPNNYRWSSILLGIVKSVPFQMRRSES